MHDQITAELVNHWHAKADGADSVGWRMARAAWVSTYDKDKAEQRTCEQKDNVVRYLVESDPPHSSPLEHVYFEYWVKCPIFVERQFDKYRLTVQSQDFVLEYYGAGFERVNISQNEQSGRYRTMPEEWYGIPQDLAWVATYEDAAAALRNSQSVCKAALGTYNKGLAALRDRGWHSPKHPNNHLYRRYREVLRGVLPLNLMTQMRIVLNTSALSHILDQRMHPTSQLEARVLGAKMFEQARDVLPRSLIDARGWEDMYEAVKADCRGD